MAKKFAYAEPVLSAPSRSNTMKPGPETQPFQKRPWQHRGSPTC